LSNITASKLSAQQANCFKNPRKFLVPATSWLADTRFVLGVALIAIDPFHFFSGYSLFSAAFYASTLL
jgi:hypothetical protein